MDVRYWADQAEAAYRLAKAADTEAEAKTHAETARIAAAETWREAANLAANAAQWAQVILTAETSERAAYLAREGRAACDAAMLANQAAAAARRATERLKRL